MVYGGFLAHKDTAEAEDATGMGGGLIALIAISSVLCIAAVGFVVARKVGGEEDVLRCENPHYGESYATGPSTTQVQ